MRVRLTATEEGDIWLQSPFDRPFVEALKAAIPWGGRAWDQSCKRWRIQVLYEQELLNLCTQWGEVVDARTQNGTQEGETLPVSPTMPPELSDALAQLYLLPTAPLVVAETVWKTLSRYYHPDNQQYGDTEKMVTLNTAIATIRHYFTEGAPDA